MAHRVAGWVSCAQGRTDMHDAITGNSFPSDHDQRHTVKTYVNFAASRTLDMSSKLTWGSGLPVSGFLTIEDGQYFLTDRRNSARLPDYFRLDFRINKTWNRSKWKKSLYIEVLDATNRANDRFGSLDWYSPATGKAEVTIDQMFPILPNAGFVIER